MWAAMLLESEFLYTETCVDDQDVTYFSLSYLCGQPLPRHPLVCWDHTVTYAGLYYISTAHLALLFACTLPQWPVIRVWPGGPLSQRSSLAWWAPWRWWLPGGDHIHSLHVPAFLTGYCEHWAPCYLEIISKSKFSQLLTQLPALLFKVNQHYWKSSWVVGVYSPLLSTTLCCCFPGTCEFPGQREGLYLSWLCT